MRTILVFAVSMLVAVPAFAEDTSAPPKSRSIDVAVGQTVLLQMASKRPIKSVVNDNANVLRVSSVPNDPTTIILTGLAVGRAHLTLTDIDGKEESRDLGKPSGK